MTGRVTGHMADRLMTGPGVVVVGNGMAGSRLVTELRSRDRDVPVTVFGAEASPPYNRVLLSNVLAGKSRPGDIHLTDPGWYAANGVGVRPGVTVTGIDRAARTVTSADGALTPYATLHTAGPGKDRRARPRPGRRPARAAGRPRAGRRPHA